MVISYDVVRPKRGNKHSGSIGSMQYMLVITMHNEKHINERAITCYRWCRSFPAMEVRDVLLEEVTQELGLSGSWVEFI